MFATLHWVVSTNNQRNLLQFFKKYWMQRQPKKSYAQSLKTINALSAPNIECEVSTKHLTKICTIFLTHRQYKIIKTKSARILPFTICTKCTKQSLYTIFNETCSDLKKWKNIYIYTYEYLRTIVSS